MKYEEITLADAVEFIVDNRGKTVPIVDSGFPLIATNCVSNNSLYPEFIKLRFVSKDTYENWFRAHPKPMDVIITNKGSNNGAVALVPAPVPFCIAQDMVALRAKKDFIYPKYLFAALRSDLVQKRIKDLNVDSVIPHFKKTDFNKLYFPKPNYSEQKRIGDLYFSYCEKIETNRQINQALEQIAQAIFKSWFVDFEPVKAKIAAREALIAEYKTQSGKAPSPQEIAEVEKQAAIAAIAGAGDIVPTTQLQTLADLFPNQLVESELGEIPKGWEYKKLKDICRVINGRAYKNSEFKEDGTPIVRIQNLSGKGKTVYSDLDLPEDKLIDKEDFIYAWSATFGPHIWRGNKSIYHYHIWKMDTDERVVSRYFLYLAMFWKTEQMKAAATGSIFTHLTKGIMESQDILVVTPDLNTFVAHLFDNLFLQITNLSEENSTLEALRDSLLPKLLSGELELTNKELM
jgi:type I restriction enzyme S subunit